MAGFSRSADFTVYALLTAPDVFRRYISIDSYNDAYFTLEEALAARRKDLAKKVYLSSRFPRSGVHEFAEKLRSRGYAGLDVEATDVASMRHFAAAAEGLSRGLKFVFNKRSVYEALLPLAAAGDIDAVVAEHQRLRRQPAENWEFGEKELLELGNALVHMKRDADAVRIYALNLEAHPQSAETYSRLSAAYARLGNTEKAMDSYREALRRDPGNKMAAEAVRRLEQEQRPRP